MLSEKLRLFITLIQSSLIVVLLWIVIVLYPFLIIVLILKLNVGVFGWLIIGGSLTPPTIIYYKIAKKHLMTYLKSLQERKRGIYNIERTVQEYTELLKKQKKDKNSS